MAPCPLLEFFKRGEVARDVRLLAAQGEIAPRATEQLSILVLLLDDPDAEVRRAAEETLGRIPAETLAKFLARPDTTPGVREFFGDRGIFPADAAGDDDESPLIDQGAAEEEETEEDKGSVLQRLQKMGFSERLKSAIKGSREMRAILVRDPNKMIAAAVMSSPKLTQPEVESIAKMANVSDEILRMIGANRAWTRNYAIVVGLTRNPKTPVALSMNLMHRLSDRDLTQLSVDRNVPDPVRVAARKRIMDSSKK